MEYLFLAGVVGLFLGVILGVFFMSLLAAARDDLPAPASGRASTGRATWPDLRESRVVASGPARAPTR